MKLAFRNIKSITESTFNDNPYRWEVVLKDGGRRTFQFEDEDGMIEVRKVYNYGLLPSCVQKFIESKEPKLKYENALALDVVYGHYIYR